MSDQEQFFLNHLRGNWLKINQSPHKLIGTTLKWRNWWGISQKS